MRTTIDRAGRVVIPLTLRAEVGLDAGGEVNVVVQGSAILIEPVSGDDVLEENGLLVIPSTGHPIDDETVSRMRRMDRR